MGIEERKGLALRNNFLTDPIELDETFVRPTIVWHFTTIVIVRDWWCLISVHRAGQRRPVVPFFVCVSSVCLRLS
jgi:hypothetical protein